MLSEILRFNKWLRRKAPNAATHIHYTNDVDLFFAWVGKPPAQVTHRDIDLYIERCLADGHAVNTVNRRLAAIRSLFRFLSFESPDILSNPVIPGRHYIRQGRLLPRDVEDRDIEQLFAVIRSPRDRCIFLLMLRCGLRVGEVHRLSLGDLYLHPAASSLPRMLLRGKNSTERIAYLSPQAMVTLQAWLAVRPPVEDDAVFLNRFASRLSVAGIQYRLACHCQTAGLWITCHQLRHTFARHLVEAGLPVTSIQRLMGHARLRSTETYLHISDRQLQADYEAAMQQVMGWVQAEEVT